MEDLRESVAEMDEMESLRIEAELEKQHATVRVSVSSDNRDSGVNDCDSHDTPARYRVFYKLNGGLTKLLLLIIRVLLDRTISHKVCLIFVKP